MYTVPWGEESCVIPLENFLAEASPNLVTRLMGLPDTQNNKINKKRERR